MEQWAVPLSCISGVSQGFGGGGVERGVAGVKEYSMTS